MNQVALTIVEMEMLGMGSQMMAEAFSLQHCGKSYLEDPSDRSIVAVGI